MGKKKIKLTDEYLEAHPNFRFLWKLEVPFNQLANAWYMAEIVSLETYYYGASENFTWFTRSGISDMEALKKMCLQHGVIITDVSDDIELQEKFKDPDLKWNIGL